MFETKNHVGRPSNEEIRKRNIKKILLYAVPGLIILLVIGLFVSGNLNSLMGNSTSQYYCSDSTYTLNGTKCIKKIKSKAYFLGDVDKDGEISIMDATKISNYIEKNIKLDDNQFAVADINKDEKVNEADKHIIQVYLAYFDSDEYISEYNIGKEKVCPKDYKLEGDYCTKTIEEDASIQKNNKDTKASIGINNNIIKISPSVNSSVVANNTVINFKIDFEIDLNNQYYYNWRVYKNNDTTPSNSDKNKCSLISSKSINTLITVNEINMYGEISVYSDNNCKNIIKSEKTIVYSVDAFGVSYDKNGGSGNMASHNIRRNSNETLSKINYKKDNYKFLGWIAYKNNSGEKLYYCKNSSGIIGWHKKQDCKNNIIYKNMANVSKVFAVGSNIVMEAQWEQLKLDLEKTSGIKGGTSYTIKNDKECTNVKTCNNCKAKKTAAEIKKCEKDNKCDNVKKCVAVSTPSKSNEIKVYNVLDDYVIKNSDKKSTFTQNFAITDKYIYFSFSSTDNVLNSNVHRASRSNLLSSKKMMIKDAGHSQSFDVLTDSNVIYINNAGVEYKSNDKVIHSSRAVAVTTFKENGGIRIPGNTLFIKPDGTLKSIKSTNLSTEKYYEELGKIKGNNSAKSTYINHPQVGTDGINVAILDTANKVYVYSRTNFSKANSKVKIFRISSCKNRQGIEISENYLYQICGMTADKITIQRYNIPENSVDSSIITIHPTKYVDIDLSSFYKTDENNNIRYLTTEPEGMSIYNKEVYINVASRKCNFASDKKCAKGTDGYYHNFTRTNRVFKVVGI